MSKKIIFVIRQPGTANAFIPLLNTLKQRDDFEIRILAFDLSWVLLENAGVEFSKIIEFSDALHYLVPNSDYLVTGTSENVTDDELFWKWANVNHIPSLAFVDQWSNLAQRFDCENLPATIAVIDEKAQQELESVLADRCRIVITGSPVFDALKELVNSSARSSKELIILFVLEPDITGMSDVEIRSRLGFTEADCLKAGYKAACELARRKNIFLRFTLKPHPRDDRNRVQQLVQELEPNAHHIPIEVWQGSKEEALIESDIVMGIRSMLLLEAAFVLKPVISIQLNRKTSSLLTDGRKGIRLALSEKEIEQQLDDSLATPIRDDNYPEFQSYSAIEHFITLLRS